MKLPQKSGAIPLSHHITDCEFELRTKLSSSSFSGNFPPNQWGEGEVVVRFLACETILVGFSECTVNPPFVPPGGKILEQVLQWWVYMTLATSMLVLNNQW